MSYLLLHVKWTSHALESARERATMADLGLLMALMLDGSLLRSCEPLRGDERGAIKIGSCWLVVKRDERHLSVLTLLTFLGGDALFTRRRDTRVLTLHRAQERIPT